MSSKFRTGHLFQLLQTFDFQTLPLDVFLRNYLKNTPSIGSHDRKYLSETIYGLVRWLGLIDFFCGPSPSWEKRVSLLSTLRPEEHLNNESIPLHRRVSFPEDYFTLLVEQLGESQAKEFCIHCNYPAPVTVRANTLKTSREELLARWKGTFDCRPGRFSSSAIQFPYRVNLFGLPEFKEGLFEVQDEASQQVAFSVGALPGDHILDYCAGSGGKTLAMAPNMQGKGQLYLHDVRPRALVEAKKRLKRAGIQNVQIIEPSSPEKNRLKGKMDRVLVDAPCSGSGTLRRNPDMKWKFKESDLSDLVSLQRQIFAEAFSFVKSGGTITYATCSVLPPENDLQTDYFLENFPLDRTDPPFRSFPTTGGPDGFYAVTLQKR